MAHNDRTNRRIIVLVSLLLLVPAVASAQRGGRGFGRMLGRSKADLATIGQVQSELNLNDQQKAKVESISDDLRKDRRDVFQSMFDQTEQIPAKMRELNQAAEADLQQVLDPQQSQRLQQIAIQVNGPIELFDPAVSERLQLSEQQRNRLEEAQRTNNQAVREAWMEMDDLSRDERRAKMRAMFESARQSLLDVLTAEQRAEFDGMQGDEFEIDWRRHWRRSRHHHRRHD